MLKNIILITFQSYFVLFGCTKTSNNQADVENPQIADNPSIVKISQKNLYVNSERYIIKGICYGRDGYFNYTEDIKLMKEANINTIRVYEPITSRVELDAFYDAGIKIIMQVDYNGGYEDYVKNYKDHPAILMWEVGNENNFHPDWFGGNLNVWYRLLEEVAQKIKTIDSNHPVSTAHGEVPTKLVLNSCPSVDIWGMNIYRWDNSVSAVNDFREISDKPLYVSEAGADSYDIRYSEEREELQAKANQKILNDILSKTDECIGVTLFSFADEWWKAGNPSQQDTGGDAPGSTGVPYDGTANEEYWGILKRDRTKKESFNIVKGIYE
jgi:beta-glucosidase/6-phospho-beta-glucosidase/beta-galactosidase